MPGRRDDDTPDPGTQAVLSLAEHHLLYAMDLLTGEMPGPLAYAIAMQICEGYAVAHASVTSLPSSSMGNH